MEITYRHLQVFSLAVVFVFMNIGHLMSAVAGGIAVEASGTLVVPKGDSKLLRVDPASGLVTLVSGCPIYATPCPEEVVGSGPPFSLMGGIVVEANGSLVVAVSGSVMRVHPMSGDRSIVSEDSADSPFAGFASNIALESNGSLIATARGDLALQLPPIWGLGAVVRIDPTTEAQTLLSGGGLFGARVGRGPRLIDVGDIAVKADGNILVVEGTYGLRGVVQVDRTSGHRRVVSNDRVGDCPIFLQPRAIAVDPQGALLVGEFSSLVRVHPVSGDRTVISGCPQPSSPCSEGELIGSGPVFECLGGIALENDASIVVVDGCVHPGSPLGVVIRVDPGTGNGTLVAELGE